MLSALSCYYLKEVRNAEHHLKETNSFDTYTGTSVKIGCLCSSKTSAVMLLYVLSVLIECSFLKVSHLLLQAPQFVGPLTKSALHLMLCLLGLMSSL